MRKDYSSWHNYKTYLNNKKRRPYFHEREIWFCSMGLNIGFEQDGKDNFLRPVIILRKFNNKVALIVPLTRKSKMGIYYFNFKLKNITSTAILSQIRLIDTKRLMYKIGNISKDNFKVLKEKVIQLLSV